MPLIGKVRELALPSVREVFTEMLRTDRSGAKIKEEGAIYILISLWNPSALPEYARSNFAHLKP